MDGYSHHRQDFESILAWIEAELEQPLTLETIARHAGLSPYHFSRLFTARTGRSVMAHVRHLRLVKSARRLAADPRLKLIDLALDCGFESQEAFTRAFRRTFGTSPGRLRQAYLFPTEETGMPVVPETSGVRVELLPERVRRAAFSVAGLSHRFDQGTKLAIPGLWARLEELMPFPGQIGRETYGVVSSVNRADGSFLYMAAGRLDPAAATPAGLTRQDVPAGTYAVFRLTMAGGPVHPQVNAAMRIIWSELIPTAGLEPQDAPDYELYAGDLPPDQPGAVIDYHVPLQTG